MTVPPLHRFEEFGFLNEVEREAILKLPEKPYLVRRGASIRSISSDIRGFYFLIEGWAAAWNILPNGGRLIANIHLPGDAMGTPSMATHDPTENLSAITDAVVAQVPLKRFGALFEDHPRLAAKFFLSVQLERIALMDRLAAIGRVGAEASVAALLVDLYERLKPLNLVEDGSFELMVTQEEMGDVLGLSAVHVNRMLSSLSAQGLIERHGRRYRLPDIGLLSRMAGRPVRTPFTEQDWLPPAR